MREKYFKKPKINRMEIIPGPGTSQDPKRVKKVIDPKRESDTTFSQNSIFPYILNHILNSKWRAPPKKENF